MSIPHMNAMSPIANIKGGGAPQSHQHPQSISTSDVSIKRHSNPAQPRAIAQPRNMQGHRKRSKAQRRPRLEDEGPLAEHQVTSHAPSSRRGQMNITHLMSFALPPRPQNTSLSGIRNGRRNADWGIGSGYHAADKARYIHANYRFVVDPRGSYSAQLADSEVHLDWDQVLQVLATVTEDTLCPICLSTPVAPRMAKCGHIFCLPCLIRLMHATDGPDLGSARRRRWKPCPICFDSMFMHEVKSVRWIHGSESERPREGTNVTLRLMTRLSSSTLALPRDALLSNAERQEVPWYFGPDVLEYAHFMLGSEDYMHAQYNAEIDSLLLQEKEDELLFGEETTWTEKAVSTIRELGERLVGLGNPLPNGSTVQLEFAQLQSAQPPAFHFYQGPLHSFLSPLDIRVLKAAFGDFALFPTSLLPRVEHISTGFVIDEAVKKRARYLSHLPLGSEVNFLECDWTEIVPQHLLQTFAPDLERRRKLNKEKAVQEERARVRAEQNEDKKYYGRRDRTVVAKDRQVTSQTYLDDDLPTLASPDLVTPSTSPPKLSELRHVSSFSSLTSPSSPTGLRTVWGTPAVAAASPSFLETQRDHDSTVETGGWLQNWEQDLLNEEDMVAAEKPVSIDNGEGSSSTISKVGNRKKKKKTKITLMSTNGRRAA